MKLKTLLVLDILNNSAAAAQTQKWLKMTEAEKIEARRKEERPVKIVNGISNTFVSAILWFFVICLAIGFWYITIPVITIYLIWRFKHGK